MKAPGGERGRTHRGEDRSPHPWPRSLRIEFGALGVAIGLVGLVVKLWLRPHQLGGPEWTFLYGVAPSFCFTLGMLLLFASRGKSSLRLTLGFAGVLVVDELLQPYVFVGRFHFDPFDVVAILAGVGAYLAYRAWRAGPTTVREAATTTF